MKGINTGARDAVQNRNTEHMHPESVTSGVSQAVEESPVYVLEWDRDGCRRTLLKGADDLQAWLDGGGTEAKSKQRLFVVHGLPAEIVRTLRQSLNIDAAFLEAHAGRRRYRPLRWRNGAAFAHYEYPELVRGFAKHVASEKSGESRIDLLGKPAIRSMGGAGDLAAVFCHASLWMTDQADVLFLDRPVWQDASSWLRKARRPASVVKPNTVRSKDEADTWEVMGSLEDILLETLKDAEEIGDLLVDLFTEISYDHWLELLGLLEPNSQPTERRATSFYWQVLQSLEQNADMSKYLKRQGRTPIETYADWSSLLRRVTVRIDMLALSPPRPAVVPGLIKSSQSSKKTSRMAVYDSSMKGSMVSSGVPSLPSLSDSDNQRSLDRISYIGGCLIPFPIVSGILSMGDTFGPKGDMFYVFWAVSLPISLVVMVIIYADSLRKLEVWVEIAAEKVTPSKTPTGKHVTHDHSLDETTTGKPLRAPLGAGQQRLRPGVTFNMGQEEAFIGLPVVTDQDEPTDGEDAEQVPELESVQVQPEPQFILVDGSPPKAWKRKRLGWAGAARYMIGYEKMRRVHDFLPHGIVAYEKPLPISRRKTVTL